MILLMDEIKIIVTREHNGIPEGSTIHLIKELKNEYKGVWSSMVGSCVVKVKKKYSKIK